MLASGQLPGCLSGFPQIQLTCSDRDFPGAFPPFWTRKGLGGCWAQLNLPAVPFREVASKLYTKHSFNTCVPTAQQHSCIWLFSKQSVISWDGIEHIYFKSFVRELPFSTQKKGCILIVFIIHSDQSHDEAKTIQQNPVSKFLKHSQIFVLNSL